MAWAGTNIHNNILTHAISKACAEACQGCHSYILKKNNLIKEQDNTKLDEYLFLLLTGRGSRHRHREALPSADLSFAITLLISFTDGIWPLVNETLVSSLASSNTLTSPFIPPTCYRYTCMCQLRASSQSPIHCFTKLYVSFTTNLPFYNAYVSFTWNVPSLDSGFKHAQYCRCTCVTSYTEIFRKTMTRRVCVWWVGSAKRARDRAFFAPILHTHTRPPTYTHPPTPT